MSLVRAFTKRTKRPEIMAPPPTRAASTKKPGQSISRAQISSPVALLSTTNMLSYNAPDIASIKRHASSSSSSSVSSRSSAEESDVSSSSNQSGNDTDATSVTSSPTSPEPNHLSCYFPPANKQIRRSVSTAALPRKSETVEDAPAIPKRALSHSKKAHEQVARQRSMQSMSTRSSLTSSREHRSSQQRSSIDIFRGSVDPSHPFGKELEQLNEIAEEFGSVSQEVAADEDTSSMQQQGLAKFCASEYLLEIQPLYSNIFGDRHLQVSAAWI